jgi:hypothetical protein
VQLGSAQDHKRVGDGDTGPNTGGMGAYAPAPVMTPEIVERTMRELIEPTMRGMAEIGAPFSGVLFLGLMIGKDGPKLIEYNTRFGDPECQVLMMRLNSDLLTLLNAAVDGKLDQVSLDWKDDPALTIVMAAEGYPTNVKKGSVIRGRQWRSRAERDCRGQNRRRSASQGLRRHQEDRLAGRFLPHRHRLARCGARETSLSRGCDRYVQRTCPGICGHRLASQLKVLLRHTGL